MVDGGFPEISYTTLETREISFMMRLETWSKKSYGSLAQRAVIKSTVSTARSAITKSYLLSSPVTPTDLTGRNTAKA